MSINNSPSRQRLALFYVMALAIPLLFFLLLEAGLRWFDYGDNVDLFIPAPSTMGNEAHWVTNPRVAQRYFPKGKSLPSPAYETFLQRKPDNAYRVFVLGGSTAATWPYPENVLFSRILAQRLSDAFPMRHIEVVNTGIAAVNSFTLLDFMDEILAQQPDAILIYAGHNEFYGALGAASSQSIGQSRWLIKSYLVLLRLKTVQLLRDLVNATAKQLRADSSEGHATLMGRMVGQDSIALNSDTYLAAKANFAANLHEILAKAQGAGIPVLVSEVVSNLRDHPPFVSMAKGDQPAADQVYVEAQQLEQAGQFDQAREAYRRAKDLDGLRFRAPTEFNRVINEVAAEFAVPVVPMVSYFEQASRHGLIGKELMLEHLHPNVSGYFLMSEAFFDGMRQHGFIEANWEEPGLFAAEAYRRSWPITALDHKLGEIRIINLTDHWPYPPKPAGERSIDSFEPRDMVEAIAIKTYKEEISYVQAHLELAAYYESKGQLERAFREHLALISAIPDDISHYLRAVSKLLERQDYARAMPLLQVTLDIHETAYAHKWIGQIHLVRNQAKLAQPYLERAVELDAEDLQAVYSLGFSSVLTGDLERARMSLKHLQAKDPNLAGTRKLEKMLAEQGAGESIGEE